MERYAGKVAYILGGGSQGGPGALGNGRAIAMRLADEGARVVVVDRDLASAEETLGHCRHGGLALEADATDEAASTDAVRRAELEVGPLDVVVGNVGIELAGRPALGDVSMDEWDLITSVNVTSHWLTVRAALPGMLERGSGNFVLIGSTAGLTGSGAYGVTKAATIGLARSISSTYSGRGIRANVVAPGLVETPMLLATVDGRGPSDELRERMYPMRRAATPHDVAAAAAFLGSDDAGYITGHVLTVDGGLTTRSFLAVNDEGLHRMGLAITDYP